MNYSLFSPHLGSFFSFVHLQMTEGTPLASSQIWENATCFARFGATEKTRVSFKLSVIRGVQLVVAVIIRSLSLANENKFWH